MSLCLWFSSGMQSLIFRAGWALSRAANRVGQARSFRNHSSGVLVSEVAARRTAKWASAAVAGGAVAGWCTAASAAGMAQEARCEPDSQDQKNHERVALLEVRSKNDRRLASLLRELV